MIWEMTASPRHTELMPTWTLRDNGSTQKICTGSKPDKIPALRRGREHGILLLTKKLFVVDTCWEKKNVSLFNGREINSQSLWKLHGRPNRQTLEQILKFSELRGVINWWKLLCASQMKKSTRKSKIKEISMPRRHRPTSSVHKRLRQEVFST